MKLFVIHSSIQPNIYCKAETPEEVLEKFKMGFDDECYQKCINHEDFGIKELDLQTFMQLVPDEFQINNDTSF